MLRLTITSKGQVTLKQELLKHLGVEVGQQIEVDTLANGSVIIRAVKPKRKVASTFGILASKTKIVCSIEEITEAAKKGWGGQ